MSKYNILLTNKTFCCNKCYNKMTVYNNKITRDRFVIRVSFLQKPIDLLTKTFNDIEYYSFAKSSNLMILFK